MEIWVPYGDVETLLNLQAENLGEVIEPKAEDHTDDLVEKLSARFKESERVILTDNRHSTIRLLQAVVRKIPPSDGFRVLTPLAKDVEQRVPELKGKVVKFQEARERVSYEQTGVDSPRELLDSSRKLILGTAIPDPLLGLVDSGAGLALQTMGGARKLAYLSRETDEPSVLTRTKSYDMLIDIAGMVPNSQFATIFATAGEPNTLVEGPAIGDARSHFHTASVAPAKGVIVAPGGKGYDGNLSQAIRLLWNVVDVVRKSGEIVLVSECREGVGSEALEMVATGRISGDSLKKGSYFEGAEEISYLSRLRENYSLTLLSALPELYAGTRLRFRTAKSGVEAINKALNSAGRNTKFHVIPRLGETLAARTP